jgi:hypothetical protein
VCETFLNKECVELMGVFMEKKHSIVAFGLFIVLFVFLLGCTLPPIKTETAEYTYIFKKDGSIRLETIQYGKLPTESEQAGMQLYGSIEDWEKDCTKELSKGFKEYKNFFILSLQSQDMNDEQREQVEKVVKAIDELQAHSECKFTANKDDNTAVFEITYELSKETLQALTGIAQQTGNKGMSLTFIPVITDNASGQHVDISLKTDTTSGTNWQVKKIKIKVEGELTKLSPESYTKEGDYYVFSDVEKLKGSTISFDYKLSAAAPETASEETPAGTGTEGAEKPPAEAVGGEEKFSLFGIEVPVSPELMLYGLVAIIALIVLIVLIAFIRSKQGKGEKKGVAAPEILEKEPGQALITETHKEKPKAAVLDLKESVESSAKARPISESDIVVETRKEPIPEEPKAGPVREEPKAKPEPASALSEADIRTVERAVVALAPKKDKYKPEQLRKVMLEMGYKEEVANEIIKRLYE